MFRPTIASIRVQSLRHNVRTLMRLNGESRFFCPMVKGNAYGHSVEIVVRALLDEGVSQLGVSLVEEGVALREMGFDQCEILIFYPSISVQAAKEIEKYRLTPVISSWNSFSNLMSALSGRSCDVHVKFNTAMNRIGFPDAEAGKVRDFLRSHPKLRLRGICTHLLAGEDLGCKASRTGEQMARMSEIQKVFSGSGATVHVFNSGALLASHCRPHAVTEDWGARPGISLYGVKPKLQSPTASELTRWQEVELKPVMFVTSEVCQIQRVAKGETVSYNGRFVASRDSTIGVIPIGYADGYLRAFSNRGTMICSGKAVPVTGTVCMDFTMIDLTDLAEPASGYVGAPVTVLGEQHEVAVDTLAEAISTNTYEIFTNFSARVPRVVA